MIYNVAHKQKSSWTLRHSISRKHVRENLIEVFHKPWSEARYGAFGADTVIFVYFF